MIDLSELTYTAKDAYNDGVKYKQIKLACEFVGYVNKFNKDQKKSNKIGKFLFKNKKELSVIEDRIKYFSKKNDNNSVYMGTEIYDAFKSGCATIIIEKIKEPDNE